MKQRVRKSRKTKSKNKVIYYGIDEGLKQQFSELSSVLLVGDVIWSKFPGHNWWPSIVSYDPNTALYFQTSAKYPNIPFKYHVQFFGKISFRGWVTKSNILKFQGEEHFLQITCNSFPSSEKEIWNQAVKNAEEAVLLDRKKRKLAYGFNGLVKSNTSKIQKKVSAHVERRRSSRINNPHIQDVKLPIADRKFIFHNTRLSARSINSDQNTDSNISVPSVTFTDSSNLTNALNVINSAATFVHTDLEANKTHTNLLPSVHNSVVNVNQVVSKTSVLQDVLKHGSRYQQNETNILNVDYPNTENSSDSGIEDLETLESYSDDMDSLELKRKRKRKVFEGFHTGDEIIDAFKSKSKGKVGSANVKDKETVINNKLEKENIVTASEVSDVIVNIRKYRKAIHKSPKKCTGANQNDVKSVPEKTPVKNICGNETLNANVEYLSNGTRCKRKCVKVKKVVETSKLTASVEVKKPVKVKKVVETTKVTASGEAEKPYKKEKLPAVVYTKIKACEISEKTKPVISVDKSATKRKVCEISEKTKPDLSVDKSATKQKACEISEKTKPVLSVDKSATKRKVCEIGEKTKPGLSVDRTATKQKACEISKKTKPGLSVDKSATKLASKEGKIGEYVKINQIEDPVVELIKCKRDPMDQFCIICEQVSGELISCSGTCLHKFHANCLGLNFLPTSNFTCDECTTGYHICFVCHIGGKLKKCSQGTCGKYYHIQCLQSSTFDTKSGNKFICPLHVCRYCNKNKSSQKCNGRGLLKCVRCPVAYHSNDCLPAGCLVLSLQHMVCDEHLEAAKGNGTRVNTTWCFVCSRGGSLVCCDTCPASFHVECSDDLTGVPDGAWRCQDCHNGSKLMYGDIVWVKYSIYRWWPGRICLPEESPEKIQNLPHSVGEFPVLFFGSQDYCWLSARRVFKYAEGDKGSRESKGYLAKYFQKALEEAKEAFSALEKRKEKRIQAFDKKQSNKLPSYGHIKVNRPVSCIQTVLDRSEWPICQCNVDDPCKNECLNKMLNYECNPLQCPNKENCKNQRMQKCQYAKTQVFKCEEKGWGLKSNQEIKTGDFVIEYIGELIDEATCRLRIQQYHEKDIYDYYFLTIDKDNIIDAYPKGNLSRFMNHSCDPNCETQKWTVNGEVRVGLFATRDIIIGEELSFNYNLDCLGNEKKKCKCGAANCSGFLGVQPKTQHSMTVAEKAKKLKDKTKYKRKLKRKKKVKIIHDDECFSCGDGGELICCDRSKCTKAYHQDCMIMDERPKRKWECPWHFCDDCGKLARSMCSLCPNSFCESHLNGQMIELKEDVIVCPVHDEEEIEYLKREKVDNPNNSEESNINGDSKLSPINKKASKSQNNESISVNSSSPGSVKKKRKKENCLDSSMLNVGSKAVKCTRLIISPTRVPKTSIDKKVKKAAEKKSVTLAKSKKNMKTEVAKRSYTKKTQKSSTPKKDGIDKKKKSLTKPPPKVGVKLKKITEKREVSTNIKQRADVISSSSEMENVSVQGSRKKRTLTSFGNVGKAKKKPASPKSKINLVVSIGKDGKERKRVGKLPIKGTKKRVGKLPIKATNKRTKT